MKELNKVVKRMMLAWIVVIITVVLVFGMALASGDKNRGDVGQGDVQQNYHCYEQSWMNWQECP